MAKSYKQVYKQPNSKLPERGIRLRMPMALSTRPKRSDCSYVRFLIESLAWEVWAEDAADDGHVPVPKACSSGCHHILYVGKCTLGPSGTASHCPSGEEAGIHNSNLSRVCRYLLNRRHTTT